MSKPCSAARASCTHGTCSACADGLCSARRLETSSQFGEKAKRTRATSSAPNTNLTI
jgi:hypothetical protein